jgi:hypothetical protein
LLQLVVMPPDGVFLQTLRSKGFWTDPNSLLISLYRTPKDEFGGLPSADNIFNPSILGIGKVNQGIARGSDDFVRIGEIALFY